jgi:hypothetical protein
MASVGAHIENFTEEQNWETYLERLEIHFQVKKVKNDEKVSVLLSCLGPKVYENLRGMMTPNKPITQTYEAVTKVLNDHYCPKPLSIAERFRLRKRKQAAGESISQYVADLRRLASSCDYKEFLEEALRDQFVCGLRHGPTMEQLLTTPDLTLKKAIDVAQAHEMAAKDSDQLQQQADSASGTVHKVKTGFNRGRQQQQQQQMKCYCCGKAGHSKNSCKFKNEKCHVCGRTGHLRAVCRDKSSNNQSNRKAYSWKSKSVKAVEEDDDDPFFNIGLLEAEVHTVSAEPIWVTPKIQGKRIKMELDTGAAVSVLPFSDYERHFRHMPLEETSMVLKAYGNHKIVPEGKLSVKVEYEDQQVQTQIHVVKLDGPALFGRDLLALIKLNWTEIYKVHADRLPIPNQQIKKLKADYKEVFNNDMGKLTGMKAQLHVKDTVPKFRPARQVPYSIRPNVERELQRLEDLEIISPVESSEWATPVVPVLKKNGEVRLCGDFKTTVNPDLIVDSYPLPRIEDVFATLGGGKTFTKLDLKQAYLQMEVEESSKKYLTINTHKGLFQYNRLLFGIASAPAIWQRTIEQVLQGCKGVQVLLDDMIITGSTEEEHLENLRAVLSRLQERGLKVNPDKCEFMQSEVTFCAHRIDATGIHMTDDKVDAVHMAPAPTNVTELRAFLGMINYYHRFLPDLATVLHPLHVLLGKKQKWKWEQEQQKAFDEAKTLITSKEVLTHYDPELEITLATDASPYGLGAVLSHKMPNGEERPIAYASRSLTSAETNYAQIDKEALAIVWGVKKFFMYLFGRHFTLITDHKPLTTIFHPGKNIPVTTAARLTRYALFLSGLQYDIKYRESKQHCNADGLSRLPQKQSRSEVIEDPVKIMHMSQFNQLPVTSAQVSRETAKDRVLAKAYQNTMDGWNHYPVEPALTPFYNRRAERRWLCDVGVKSGHP